ncbi:MAG: pglA [Bryobacterales bacterium]|nr:pglA [Bryobacterales bacterium]
MLSSSCDRRVRVMQVVDTLSIGGAETVAVNLANLLPQEKFAAYLCTTRAEGPLAGQVAAHVARISLNRGGRLDLTALLRIAAFVRRHNIQILHAHGTSLFLARVASVIARRGVVIWHDHYGRCDCNDRTAWPYRRVSKGIGVIAVNQSLAAWSRIVLGVPSERVWYVPNLVEDRVEDRGTAALNSLPGSPGHRIVCVANFRPQKDHMNLLLALVLLRRLDPDAHTILVGDASDPVYEKRIRSQISELGLEGCVSCFGVRRDVSSILAGCDIGVLSSVSEGLPLALLEYGMAGLAVAATDVGQCSEVLDDGAAGLLAQPASPEQLAQALALLLGSPKLRADLGGRLQARVRARYSPQTVLRQVCQIYESVLEKHAA